MKYNVKSLIENLPIPHRVLDSQNKRAENVTMLLEGRNKNVHSDVSVSKLPSQVFDINFTE